MIVTLLYMGGTTLTLQYIPGSIYLVGITCTQVFLLYRTGLHTSSAGGVRTMSTATPRDEFAPLLRVLCGPGDAGRRLAAAAEIKAIIVRADTQIQVQQVFVSLLQHLEPLLFDPSEQICRCIPPLLGALGAAQRPNLQGFFGWFVEAAQRIGPADEQLP